MNNYLDNMFKTIDPNIKLDNNQKNIVIEKNKYCLVIAGAGAGKTTTMAAKVKYLCEVENIKPCEILMISYTNKAVLELKDRINKDFKLPIKIATFHALGLEIISKYDKKKTIVTNQAQIIKRYINNYDEIKDRLIFDYIVKFYYQRLSDIIFENKKKYLEYKKNTKLYNLKSEVMDNYIDVIISNILILNKIDHEYKKEFLHNRKIIIPTFKIKDKENIIYINTYEYSNVYLKKSEVKKYQKIRTYFSKNFENSYIEVIDEKSFVEKFICDLSYHGLNLELYSSNLYKKILIEHQDKINELVVFLTNYVSLMKTKGKIFDDMNKYINQPREYIFMSIVKLIINNYDQYLENNDLIDFEMMVNKANKIIDDNDEILLDYKYIIIDEYQDIANERFNLINKLSTALNANITAVGDDWQSIFSFAGSEISLFMNFKEKFPSAVELKIVNTYRNSQKLIDIAGKFVQVNRLQIKKKLYSDKKTTNPIVIVSYSKDKNEVLKKIIDEIVNEYGLKKNILIIGRFNFELNQILKDKEFKKSSDKIIYRKYPCLMLSFMSAHSSKGLGYDNVILYNGDNSIYGFPAQIVDNSLYDLIDQKSLEIEHAEERRLFYVALTRTKNSTYIIASKTKPSVFVLEISKYKNIKKVGELKLGLKINTCPRCGYYLKPSKINEKAIYMCTNDRCLCDFKTISLNDKEPIKRCKKCKIGHMIAYDRTKPNVFNCSNGCV